MKTVIITGLSGAGKSLAVDVLEDLGFFCIDNLPPELIMKFADLILQTGGRLEKSAMVCDIRSGDISQLEAALEELKKRGVDYEILYLGASSEVLVKRYKETRRQHPLSKDGLLTEGIEKERELFEKIRKRATYDIDTSMFSATQLKEHLSRLYNNDLTTEKMAVNIISFGYKYGIPLDSDLVFDVRFLPNPYYIPELKYHTGLDSDVYDYVMSFEETRKFLVKLYDLIEYLIPLYIEEGKTQLVISIGCTGGHHRSVTIAEALDKKLKENGHNVFIAHRDTRKGI